LRTSLAGHDLLIASFQRRFAHADGHGIETLSS
jgi:hypothetical protein